MGARCALRLAATLRTEGAGAGIPGAEIPRTLAQRSAAGRTITPRSERLAATRPLARVAIRSELFLTSAMPGRRRIQGRVVPMTFLSPRLRTAADSNPEAISCLGLAARAASRVVLPFVEDYHVFIRIALRVVPCFSA
jgi:hypothetical protein